ncbi:hypothetical protein ACI2OX_03180 [Bacillus sp. N9]
MPIQTSAWQQQTNLMMTGNEKLDLIVTMGAMGYGTQAVKVNLFLWMNYLNHTARKY